MDFGEGYGENAFILHGNYSEKWIDLNSKKESESDYDNDDTDDNDHFIKRKHFDCLNTLAGDIFKPDLYFGLVNSNLSLGVENKLKVII